MIGAADSGEAVGAVLGTAAAAVLWLAFAFRSLRLRDEDSPRYMGLYRWTGEQVQTRRRAVAFAGGWGLVILVVNLLIVR
ncbi:MAG TPA: hypothetical protein VG455_05355 [Acidimicrobiales bacterium]|nr:hypothetical protein [Acidimicrobiales bacterium]